MPKANWNPQEYETSAPRNYDPIPKGRYLATIDDIEQKDTSSGSGYYYEVTLTVIAPKEYKGRKLWARLNVENKSEIAQRIGREQYNALCIAALGKFEINTDKLLAKRVVVHVGIETMTGGANEGERTNKVTGFERPSEAAATAPAPQAQSKPAPAPAAAPAPAGSKPQGKFDDFEDDIPF